MFGCWRRIDAADPETFITAVAAVLSDYPEQVVSRVTDPRTGLPGKRPFPPSAFEVKQECEAEMAPIRRQIERERRYAETRLALSAPERPRPTLEQLRARYGPNWGLTPAEMSPRGEGETSVESLRERTGLSAEQFAELWDSVPDQPGRALPSRWPPGHEPQGRAA